MKVIVDDQLMLLHVLGVIELPDSVEVPLLTTYSFQLRVASALAPDRYSPGTLQRLVDQFGPSGVDVEALIQPDPSVVRLIDPTKIAASIARYKTGLPCNTLAAEVIASAIDEGAEVRLVPGNAEGQLWDALESAGTARGVWRLDDDESRFSITEERLSGG